MLPAVVRRRRSRRAPDPSGPLPSPGAAELGRRLEALGDDLAQARAEAEKRAAQLAAGTPPSVSRSARRVAVPVVAAALAAAGTAVGLVLSGSGTPSGLPVTTADRSGITQPAPVTTADRSRSTGRPAVTTIRAPAPAPAPTAAAPTGAGETGAGPTGAGETGETATITVRAGQSFWSIAVSVVTERTRTTSAGTPIGPYWARLIEANADRLPRPGDPDLLYPGEVLVLPAG